MKITDRDRKMLGLLAQDKSAKQIARKLKLTYGTTRIYLHDLYRKIGVRGMVGAVLWWLKRNPELLNGPRSRQPINPQ